MKHIPFGALHIDPAALGSQGNAVLGIRGSGKTYTATYFAERLFDAGIPFVAFDPIGVWRFLRVPGAGKGRPIVVAGGEDGDLPLSPASAPAIVEAAMTEGISLVLDLFSMELSKADWRRIVMASVNLLLQKNQAHGLRHIFLEEAAEFVPQRVDDGQVYAAIEKLARMGGNRGLGYTLINQRAEEVNKAVLELCDNLFLHRQKGKNSIASLRKWLDFGAVDDPKAITDTLPTLPTGECWAWLGESSRPVLVKVPAKESYHPDRRVMRGDVTALKAKAVDVAGFVTALRTSIPKVEAETKANDPKELKKRIAELEAAARKTPAAQTIERVVEKLVADPKAVAEAERRGQGIGQLTGMVDGFNQASAYVGKYPITSALQAIEKEAAMYEERRQRALGEARVAHDMAIQTKPTPIAPAPKVVAPRPAKSQPVNAGDPSLTNPQLELLRSLAWWAAMGHSQPTRVQIAAIARWKPKGSNLRNRLSELSQMGLVEYPADGLVRLTNDGDAAAPEPDVNQTLIDSIRAVLTGPQGQVFEALHSAPDHTLHRTDIATAINWEPGGSNLRNRLSELSSLKLVDYPSKGVVSLQAWVTT